MNQNNMDKYQRCWMRKASGKVLYTIYLKNKNMQNNIIYCLGDIHMQYKYEDTYTNENI